MAFDLSWKRVGRSGNQFDNRVGGIQVWAYYNLIKGIFNGLNRTLI